MAAVALCITMLTLCITALPLLASEPLTRNSLVVSNLNTDKGLSSSRVYSIVEDADGAMWISTKRGVDRYNGQQVRNYNLPLDRQLTDASGRNIKLTKDGQGRIYAYDNKGNVYIYNDVLDAYQLRFQLKNTFKDDIVLNELVADHQGTLWMALGNGVYRQPSQGKGKLVAKNIFANHVSWIGNHLLIGSYQGTFVLSALQGKSPVRLKGVEGAVLASWHDAAHHQVWLGTLSNGVQVVDDRTWKPLASMQTSLNGIPRLAVRSIIPYDKNTVLVAVDGGGVYAYDRGAKRLSLLMNASGKAGNALTGNGVYTLYRDRLGDIWVGSYSGGVDLAIPSAHSISYIRHDDLNGQSLANNRVNGIFQQRHSPLKEKIWFATDMGVSIYDPTSHHWQHGLANKVVLTLCQAKDGSVLAGTYGEGVFRVSADGSARPLYSTSNGALGDDCVFALCSDREGGLWIGCMNGKLAHVTASGISYLPIRLVFSIVESPDGKHVAVGNSEGCWLIDKRSHAIRRFYFPGENPGRDFNYVVNALLFQDNSHVWIATDGGGVCLYDLQSHRVKNYTTAQALPSNTVYAFVRDGSGRVWMSTDRGLAFIDHGKVTSLNFFEGMEREFNRMAALRTHDGMMMFGSNEGAVALSPTFVDGLTYQAPLHITGLDVEGMDDGDDWRGKVHEMLQKGEVALSFAQNTFVVHFESINYQYQHDIQYQCFLDGFDRQWSQPSPSRQVRYANLPAGKYTLHVKAIGKSNGRVLGERTMTIRVAPPWWNTWWAWAFYIAALCLLAYAGWDYYKERLKRKYYDEKIRFFVNTAHNIRTPLSLVLAPLADLAKDKGLSAQSRNFLDMAQRNGDKLLRMVTELLDFQKMERTEAKVHLQEMQLRVFLEQQARKFSTMASDKNIRLGIKDCPTVKVMTDFSLIDLIFENLLSNAIKYTPEGGKVELSAAVCPDGKQVVVAVSDTGIGIPKSESRHIFQSFFRASNAVKSQEMGSGLGLMLTRQLVQKLGGKLTFESEEGKGTTFNVALPMDESVAVTQTPQEEDAEQKDTLLFVDDNADLRQYIRMAFSEKYRVVDVASGEEALAYLEEKGECDIIVSDVMMPGMQGDELCRRVKENNETSWLPVILLTAKAGRDFMMEGLGLGADDFIAKPFDSAILASKIDSMLKNRRRLSQYYMQRSLTLVRGEADRRSLANAEAKAEKPEAAAETTDETELPKELNPQDQAFVEKATRMVMDNLSDTDFSIDCLCREMAMSRTLFYGKLKTLTGQTPQDFVRLIRLEQAALLLKQGKSVLEVSVAVGFVNAKHFSTVFKKHFGVSPSKYE